MALLVDYWFVSAQGAFMSSFVSSRRAFCLDVQAFALWIMTIVMHPNRSIWLDNYNLHSSWNGKFKGLTISLMGSWPWAARAGWWDARAYLVWCGNEAVSSVAFEEHLMILDMNTEGGWKKMEGVTVMLDKHNDMFPLWLTHPFERDPCLVLSVR